MSSSVKILIIGGYGTFGATLVELIKDFPLDVLIAGRSLFKAEALCARFTGTARLTPICLDRKDIVACLKAHQPSLVVDASGPFQSYTDVPYRVVRACIAANVNYVDLADATEFVLGIGRMDKDAKAAGVYAISGLSSLPALSGAVLKDVAKLGEIETVWAGIAPSPKAIMGLNVMRAVLSYAGKPVTIRGDGPTTEIGLADSRLATIAPPGALPLRRRRFSLVDAPDLKLVPLVHPKIKAVWTGAGPVPGALHRMLNGMAWLHAKGLFPALGRFAALFHWVMSLTRIGAHRGGMIVSCTLVGGQSVDWHLIAEGDDGPFVPSMAAAALVQKHVQRLVPPAGARPADQELTLQDFAPFFAGRNIRTGWRKDGTGPLYQQLLGTAMEKLPMEVRQLHDLHAPSTWAGEAEVRPGSALGRLVARVFGFPVRGGIVPVSVQFDLDDKGEIWTRNFAGQILVSHHSHGRGRDERLLVERFGPVEVAIGLEVQDGKLRLVPRHWTVFGVSMPRGLLPGGQNFETALDGRFHFHVDIIAPVIGRIVRYRGWLKPND